MTSQDHVYPGFFTRPALPLAQLYNFDDFTFQYHLMEGLVMFVLRYAFALN